MQQQPLRLPLDEHRVRTPEAAVPGSAGVLHHRRDCVVPVEPTERPVLHRDQAKVVLIVLAFLEVVVALIPWACMTAVWHNDYCGQSTAMINRSSGKADGVPYGSVLRTSFKMSAAYGMTVAAWCVQVTGLTLLLTM
ncbi:Amastin surface glycoprotein, putative [Leishmania lindenbergi]|uniref:Amastin surface glycoprotein n=1 Tax=Leishmania lindenbergi TaxID=651832 RepID=A0AAW3A4M8_9TRYP